MSAPKLSNSETEMRLAAIFVFAAMGEGSAHAKCHSMFDVCEHIKWCVVSDGGSSPENKANKQGILKALKDKRGSDIWAFTQRCQDKVGSGLGDWDIKSAGCTDDEYYEIARKAEAANWTCKRN